MTTTFPAADAARPVPVAVETLSLAARLSLRLRPRDRAAAEAALGLGLPERIGDLAVAGARRALCLSPDEWRLDAPDDDAPRIAAALDGLPHALVDVTDRETTFRIEGPGALVLLAMGIACDLARLAPGRGARTVFDGVQAVLAREGEHRFTLAVWRSFAPHVGHMLAQAEHMTALVQAPCVSTSCVQ